MKNIYFPFESDTLPCECGKVHKIPSTKIFVGKGAISNLEDVLKSFSVKKPFILSDINTHKVAGNTVEQLLSKLGCTFSSYTFPDESLKPDEHSVGGAFMHFDASCDCIIGIGSGVINDIGKILSAVSKLPYIIVGTAPSMDGYGSGTSSMERDGLKVSINSKCPDCIIGDTDILKTAPDIMLQAGLGDMLAKYTSLAEWRISNLVTGEHYCERIAQMVRDALKKCSDNAAGLLKREDAAIEAVFEGLVLAGVAMNHAGHSRPASGVEHYLSHVWDMRSLEFGTPSSLHGIQCAIGTHIAARMFEKLKTITPDREKAIRSVEAFDKEAWYARLEEFIGKGAKTMIEAEKKDGKYDPEKHKARLEIILKNWDSIISFVNDEIPSAKIIGDILDSIGAPKEMSDIGIDEAILPDTFRATSDIRDKYVLSRLAFDLGIREELL